MAAERSRDRVTERVRALLAKADRTEHQPEADAFLAKAQALITRHHITEGELDAVDANIIHKTITLDDWGNATRGVVSLYGQVAELNRCSIGHQIRRGWARVELFGTDLDLELTTTVVDHLLPQLRLDLLRDRPRSRMSYSMGWAAEVAARLEAVRQAEAERSNALVPTNVAAADALHETFTIVKGRRAELDSRAFGSGMAAGENADIGNSKLSAGGGGVRGGGGFA